MEVRKMPIYEYVCKNCDKQIEVIQKITEAPLTVCPDCKGRLRKMISNTSFVLKGTGWYATDYASSNGSSATKASEPKKPADAKSAPAETAPAAKEPATAAK
jgi:putative FmdB family regulatory protein